MQFLSEITKQLKTWLKKSSHILPLGKNIFFFYLLLQIYITKQSISPPSNDAKITIINKNRYPSRKTISDLIYKRGYGKVHN
jgi:hypothetical protein